jgi:glycosyltransferase involved in cell wall biosynthesis
MKILHVLYSGLGGHGNVFFSMADADKENGNQYEALFFGVEDVKEEYIEKANARNIPWYAVKKKPGLDLSAYRSVRQIIRHSKPDVVFIHGSTMLFYVKYRFPFLSKKFRLVAREAQANHLKSRAENFALRICFLFADKIIFLSKEYREEVKKKFPLLFSEKRTAVIPNGLDLSVFRPQLKTEDGTRRIGMQSRLIPIKDHRTLIKAFALCTAHSDLPLQLHIAGDGTCRPALEALVYELKLEDKVLFTGLLDESELPGFIKSLDIYVHATFGETMSTALMQVMACRKPIIASDVPGVNNMITDNVTGLLIETENPEKLSAAIQSLLNDPQKAANLAENAYQYALAHFDNKLMVKRYLEVFNGK